MNTLAHARHFSWTKAAGDHEQYDVPGLGAHVRVQLTVVSAPPDTGRLGLRSPHGTVDIPRGCLLCEFPRGGSTSPDRIEGLDPDRDNEIEFAHDYVLEAPDRAGPVLALVHGDGGYTVLTRPPEQPLALPVDER